MSAPARRRSFGSLQATGLVYFLALEAAIAQPPERIRVTGVSGPFERLDGIWWLVPDSPSRTRLVYRLDIEPGPLIPNFMLSGPLRRDVLNAMRAVREGSEREP